MKKVLAILSLFVGWASVAHAGQDDLPQINTHVQAMRLSLGANASNESGLGLSLGALINLSGTAGVDTTAMRLSLGALLNLSGTAAIDTTALRLSLGSAGWIGTDTTGIRLSLGTELTNTTAIRLSLNSPFTVTLQGPTNISLISSTVNAGAFVVTLQGPTNVSLISTSVNVGALVVTLQGPTTVTLGGMIPRFSEGAGRVQKTITLSSTASVAQPNGLTLYTVTGGKTLYITQIFFDLTDSSAETALWSLKDGNTMIMPGAIIGVVAVTDKIVQVTFPDPILFSTNVVFRSSTANVTVNVLMSGWEQ